MLTLTVGAVESWDSDEEVFVYLGGTKLHLEHSLVSLSKWEQIFKKPFLGPSEKTDEEAITYIRCMIVDEDVSEDVIGQFDMSDYDAINDYMNDKMSATWFSEEVTQTKSRELITHELIYYWMSVAGIDIECKHWHLNNLFTLIRIFNVKNAPEKKKTTAELYEEHRRINEANQKLLIKKE